MVLLWLGMLLVAIEARARDGRPLLVFDASAAELPQAEIRVEVERELGGALPTSADQASGELTVLVDTSHRLVVRYRTSRGAIDRYLPMPNEPRDVSLIIALAVGNLVRDPMSGMVLRENPGPTASALVAPPATARAPKPEPKPWFPRHLLGFHLAQDIAFVDGSNVCGPDGKIDNFSCFYAGTEDEPFFHTPFPLKDEVASGPTLATKRLLVSYDFALARAATIGARVGYAFGGGPPAGQEPVGDVPGNIDELPAHTKGQGGTPFLPAHIELRAAAWVLPLGNWLSAYIGAGLGVAQVDVKFTDERRDCADTLSAEWDTSSGTYDDCVSGNPNFGWDRLHETELDAWKKLGQGFGTATAGGVLWIADELGLQLNVNAMLMFPATGFVLEPSVGIVTALPSP
ncbi:MAG TPA: hypothetical protein VFZ53_16155 [Polyangiaceae bacterium]